MPSAEPRPALPGVSAALPRRAFLAHSSLAGLGLALGTSVAAAAPAPAAGLATGSPPAAAARHRYAIVGTGSRSRLYQQALEKDYRATAELVALCDVNPGRLRLALARSRQWSGHEPRSYAPAEFEKMLAEARVQTVIVTTVDGTHHEYLVRAMRAGCDVISEKPLTTTPEKCRQILDTQAATGRRCRVTFNLRYSPPCMQVKELLARGAIGEILSVDLHWMLDTYHGADYMRRWHSRKENSGGLMVHKASHHFDLVNWWVGSEPEVVAASGQRRFYVPGTLRRYGLTRAGAQCLDCPEAARCAFQLDLRKDAELKALYLDQEPYDGYVRDRCPFRADIDIEDTMSVQVRYRTGTTLTYSLNAFCAWEGYTVTFNGSLGRLEHRAGGLTADGRVQPGAMRTTLIPLRGPAQPLEVWTGTGAHQGGDKVMLADLFGAAPEPDPLRRAADQRAGAWSTLIGMAANQGFVTGQPVRVADLVSGLAPADHAPMPTGVEPLSMPPRTRA